MKDKDNLDEGERFIKKGGSNSAVDFLWFVALAVLFFWIIWR